ncbi:hypothetical protein DAPPUDRAFT_233797 [Daphnia pulex]|uniref:Protein kinase domain-containing protein n=1 Tax=Daphnia pulex TaxID=6669 RepID=E9FVR8_DAPPU|nr:hypothetical protein DAPPUDRAFT_233797 [Daphnia pulex]|eukprot:EFX88601.1 hypothetical protein DAPPUDRAFT_233797 [Daphnia pulex]
MDNVIATLVEKIRTAPAPAAAQLQPEKGSSPPMSISRRERVTDGSRPVGFFVCIDAKFPWQFPAAAVRSLYTIRIPDELSDGSLAKVTASVREVAPCVAGRPAGQDRCPCAHPNDDDYRELYEGATKSSKASKARTNWNEPRNQQEQTMVVNGGGSQQQQPTPAPPPPPDVNNIMGGIEQTVGVRMHNHRRKLRQRFDLVRKLGQGTYGKVQLGINKETGQEVAIKTIKKAKIETEADLIRIRREIQIMSSVRHPNIIHITRRRWSW